MVKGSSFVIDTVNAVTPCLFGALVVEKCLSIMYVNFMYVYKKMSYE